jgi:oligoribonuclease NrnB/cAMP/cGMP phosphodiesterase (DHH superfamily)
MRIVTRPDFDGVVCAVLLREAEPSAREIYWVEPGRVQRQDAEIQPGDIMANLPYDPRCTLWFDHHYTNRTPATFNGAFAIEPSAARVVYDYYRDRLSPRFDELVRQADKIDSADLTEDEVLHPETYPHVLLSMTISGRNSADAFYWDRLVALLREKTIDGVMADPEVDRRCRDAVSRNRIFHDHLVAHTTVTGPVAVTDFRSFDSAPDGNRFLVYSLFKDTVVSVKIRYDQADRGRVIVSVGHSIFNRNCQVNAGLLLSRYNGGGHFGAAACSFPADRAEAWLPEIIETLKKNEPLLDDPS